MERNTDQAITVVSGLPRSGTSLVMQMLAAGGMPVLTDGVRGPDDDNPRGYFEFEPVKRTAGDASWITAAKGKAVKVIYQLLRALPGEHSYQVILLRRDIREVVASQHAMLRRLGKGPVGISDEALARGLEAGLRDAEAWLARQPNCSVLHLPHASLIASPHAAAANLSGFCGGLDAIAMASVIEPALHRQRGPLRH